MKGEYKRITAILPSGVALPLLKRLREEKGVLSTNVHRARGVGHLTRGLRGGFGQQAEKDVLNVVVESGRADEIFAFVFEGADMDRPHGGFLYQSRLVASTGYQLPDLPDES